MNHQDTFKTYDCLRAVAQDARQSNSLFPCEVTLPPTAQPVNYGLFLHECAHAQSFGTDALLLAAYMRSGYGVGAEYGAASGALSLLVLRHNKVGRIQAVEIAPEHLPHLQENARINGFTDRLEIYISDVRTHPLAAGATDTVFMNPPYMKTASGSESPHALRQAARHEVFGGIDAWCRSAARTLRWGGDFYAVYRPDRMTDLLCAMREAGIEPKRATFVHAHPMKAPCLLLIEGKRAGHAGMRLTPPLFLQEHPDDITPSKAMRHILEYGNFPSEYDDRQGQNKKDATRQPREK